MQPFRLEELQRIIVIAIAAALAFTVLSLLWAAVSLKERAAGAMDLMAFAAIATLLVATPITAIAGLVLHLILRTFILPRLLLLPLFIGVGFGVMHGLLTGYTGIHAGTILGLTVPAWAMYCFGPVKLWKYEFDLDQHGDF
jgi:hypothetical protein